MSEDATLFGEPSLRPQTQQSVASAAIHLAEDWQIARVRSLLDQLGLGTMDDRRACIEEAVGRQVESLRHLAFGEAQAVIETLAARSGSQRARGSGTTWDSREGDTWIDRM